MAVSRTAQFVALYRALESVGPRARLHDPYAARFLSPSLARAVRVARFAPLGALLTGYADLRAPGARTSAIARTLYIDDVARAAAAAGIRQLVVLGAGFDCRAHRLPELRDAVVYEVDRADTQQHKRVLLGDDARNDVRYVAIDFLRDDVASALAGAGWDAARPSLFIWEGVTNYLTGPAVLGVLSWIGRAAPGSRVVFTYVHAGVLDGSVAFLGGPRILANVRSFGEPWTFGVRPDEIAPFVARAGLTLVDDCGADEYRRRWLGRTSPGYAFYRIAVAAR
jgi:methyltransferase (TIGR00027 family)